MTKINSYPNQEQMNIIDAVLNSEQQTILVNACPGSGKTTLLVDIFQKTINNWSLPGGIACLSFTNVAQEKIKKEYGNTIPKKHFVGTFDSFIYSYIIKPYGHFLGFLQTDKLYIIENSTCKNPWIKQEDVYCGKDSNNISVRKAVLDLEFAGEYSNFPMVSYDKGKFINEWTWKNCVKKAKEDCWKKGIVSYSDLKYLALQLLKHNVYGPHILNIINYKFPYIFVDEIQDTGYFLEEILLLIMQNSKKNFFIGDSDQAIYGFAGAKARIFEVLKNKHVLEYPLTHNFRSCPNITELITAFSLKENPIVSTKDYTGNNILIVHKEGRDLSTELQKILLDLCKDKKSFAILTRRNSICNKFRKKQTINCPVSSHLAKYLTSIFNEYNIDKNKAFNSFEKCLSKLLFSATTDYELTESLMKYNISQNTWRKDIYALLTDLRVERQNETWNDWLSSVNDSLVGLSKKYGLSYTSFNNLLRQDRSNGTKNRVTNANGHENEVKDNIRIDTIHGVKGEEFESCFIYFEKPSNTNYGKCPSETWWDEDEEQRIIFVALSRAQKNLILCIHKDSYNNINNDNEKKKLYEHFNKIIKIE